MPPGCTPNLGVGGLGGDSVGLGGDRELANSVFRKSLWRIGHNFLKLCFDHSQKSDKLKSQVAQLVEY